MISIAEVPSGGGATAKDCASCNPNAKCGNGLEKVYPTCAVRYGAMNFIGEFRYAPGMLFGCGEKVVIQTDRGTEIGRQVSLTCSGCEKSVSREDIKSYVKNSGPDFLRLHAGRILRVATPEDLVENEKQQQIARQIQTECEETTDRLGLDMKTVICEYLFGGERVVIYFMSDTRVDFRELVRELAHLFHTRIEMRQVQARDEARLVADYEICGRECCCKNFLKTLRPVKMPMAKLQKATLDPSKVSGRCGRLRCCLRYEHDSYEELNARLPRVGRRVRTESGPAVVVDRQILTQLLVVEYPDNRRLTIPIEEILPDDAGAAPTDERPAKPAAPREAGRAIEALEAVSNGGEPDEVAASATRDGGAPPGAAPADVPSPAGRAERRRGRRSRRQRRREGAGGADVQGRPAPGQSREAPRDASEAGDAARSAGAGPSPGQPGGEGRFGRRGRRRRRRGHRGPEGPPPGTRPTTGE